MSMHSVAESPPPQVTSLKSESQSLQVMSSAQASRGRDKDYTLHTGSISQNRIWVRPGGGRNSLGRGHQACVRTGAVRAGLQGKQDLAAPRQRHQIVLHSDTPEKGLVSMDECQYRSYGRAYAVSQRGASDSRRQVRAVLGAGGGPRCRQRHRAGPGANSGRRRRRVARSLWLPSPAPGRGAGRSSFGSVKRKAY